MNCRFYGQAEDGFAAGNGGYEKRRALPDADVATHSDWCRQPRFLVGEGKAAFPAGLVLRPIGEFE